MKVFALVDVHGNMKLWDHLHKILKTKLKPDLIISAGDHTWFQEDEREIFKKHDIGVPVLIIPGNHEHPEEMRKNAKGMKNIILLHQGVYEKDGVLFVGCGEGGFCCGNNDFEASKSFLAQAIKSHKGPTVLVTHEPPFDTNVDQTIPGTHVGSKSLRDFIKDVQPNLHICGHIHESAGTMDKLGKTLIVQPGPKGKLIEV